jgi:hypothetical protein
MHIISYRRMREYREIHADCLETLDNWLIVSIDEELRAIALKL